MLDFSTFDLIIDARSEREYDDDHIPGSINLPVVTTAEYAEVGTLHRTDKMGAYKIGVRYSLNNIARHLADDISKYDDRARILVYCFRGGKRSKLWADALETIGYDVTRLRGGWKEYRRWINDRLASLPSYFRYHVLNGPTGCGKTRLLAAIAAAGGQALDLENLAKHRGSVIGALPGIAQPSQKLFDSLLHAELQKLNTDRPVWVEAESKKIGRVQLPDALLSKMRDGLLIQIETGMPDRVQLWREDYQHFEADPAAFLQRLRYLRPLVGGEEFSVWEGLADRREMPQLFERLMTKHYDPAYQRSMLRNYPNIGSAPRVSLHDLSAPGLKWVAGSLLKSFEG